MYSMVMLAALTSGSAAPDWGHRGCHGGWGGCYSGCYGGCYGGWGGCYGGGYGGCWCSGYGCYQGGSWGCAGGCARIASAWAGCYDCTGWNCGGAYGGWSCYSTTSYQCHGCYGGWTCVGGYQVSPYHQTPVYPPARAPAAGGKEELIPPPVKDKKDGEQVSSRGRLVVQLPADAKLYIDNQPMKTQADRRIFNTPPLLPGQTYYYDLRAEVVRDGRARSETQRVLIRAGQETSAAFPNLGATVTATAQR